MILKDGQEITTPAIDALPIGTILAFDGEVAPIGYLICNGQAVSKTTYPYLYKLIGDRHRNSKPEIAGSFYLPDLRDRTIVGYDGDNALFNSLGKNGGEIEHTLTVTEMPSHKHDFYAWKNTNGGDYIGVPTVTATTFQTQLIRDDNTGVMSVGGSAPHNNLQPFQVYNYIIKADILTVTFNKNAIKFDSAYIVTDTELPDNSSIESPLKYEVGNGSLSVYFMGEKLIKADPANSIDGHYTEVGDVGTLSNTIQFYNIGQTIPVGIKIEFVVTGGYNNQ